NNSHQWSYEFYSDDFSAFSLYGGVYCMFQQAFSIGPYGFPDRKKQITVKCRVRGFEKGGLETIDEYKADAISSMFGDTRKKFTKPRVILIGCEEIRSEWSHPFGTSNR